MCLLNKKLFLPFYLKMIASHEYHKFNCYYTQHYHIKPYKNLDSLNGSEQMLLHVTYLFCYHFIPQLKHFMRIESGIEELTLFIFSFLGPQSEYIRIASMEKSMPWLKENIHLVKLMRFPFIFDGLRIKTLKGKRGLKFCLLQ